MQINKDRSKNFDNDQNVYLTALNNIEHKVENLFRNLWNSPFRHETETVSTFPSLYDGLPKMDVIDRDKEIIVKAELPGIDKKDIDISITDNRLVIKASTEYEVTEERGDYLKQEIISSEFYRSVHLPAEVEEKKIKTSFKNGLLELTIPKHESAYRRRIKIE